MIILTDENFEKEVFNSSKPILVDFYAAWCPPCSVLTPILEKLETEYEGKVLFRKINVDNSPITSQRFGVNPIPTVILFKAGKPAGEFIGLRPEPVIKEWLENLLRNENEQQ
jgi:thioredoxin 1